MKIGRAESCTKIDKTLYHAMHAAVHAPQPNYFAARRSCVHLGTGGQNRLMLLPKQATPLGNWVKQLYSWCCSAQDQRLAVRPGLLLLLGAAAMTANEVDFTFSFVLCVL